MPEASRPWGLGCCSLALAGLLLKLLGSSVCLVEVCLCCDVKLSKYMLPVFLSQVVGLLNL